VGYDVVNGVFPKSAVECDAWLATGSRYSVYDGEPWIGQLCDFVGDVGAAEAPFAGICFGHQLLAQAVGGSVAKAPGGWGAGRHTINFNDAGEWSLLFMHQDQVNGLPDRAA